MINGLEVPRPVLRSKGLTEPSALMRKDVEYITSFRFVEIENVLDAQ